MCRLIDIIDDVEEVYATCHTRKKKDWITSGPYVESKNATSESGEAKRVRPDNKAQR